MGISIQMLQFSPAVTGARDEVGWVVVPEDAQRLLEFILLDIAVCGKVFARRTSSN